MRRILALFIFIFTLSFLYAAGLPHLVTGTVVNSGTLTHPSSIQVKINYQGSDYYWQWTAQANTLKGSLYNSGTGEFCIQVSDVNSYNTGNVAQLTIKGNDGSQATASLTKSSTSRTSIGTIEIGTNTNPNLATTPIPANEATNVSISTSQISWTYAHDALYTDPTGFKVYFDTISPPINQLTSVTGTTGTFSSPIPPLLNGTTYYWKVVPFNGGGDAINCPVWSFTTIQSTVANIVFNPQSGTYQAAQSVILTTTTLGAEIRYTLDGSEPNEASTLYSTPINIPLNTTVMIKAKAYKTNWIPSLTYSASYVVTGQVSLTMPVFIPPSGTYSMPQLVTLNTITNPAGAELRYTADGTNPITSSQLYSSAIQIPVGTTALKVKAFLTNWLPSDTETAFYTVTGIDVNPYLATLPIPENGASNVPLSTNQISWSYAHNTSYSDPTGFKVYFGMDALPGTYTYVAGSVGTFSLPVTLVSGGHYYWKVVPTTSGRKHSSKQEVETRGDAVGAVVWDFTAHILNQPPTIVLPNSFTINQNEVTTIDFSSFLSDPDSDPLTLSVIGNNHINVTIDNLIVSFTPQTNWVGNENLTFTVNDGVMQNLRNTASDVITIQVRNPLIVDFMTNSTLNNNVVANDQQTILTFNTSTNLPLTSYQWDFNNDGNIDSTLPTPTWLYTSPGTMSVALTASDGIHVSTIIKSDYINVLPGVLVPPTIENNNVVWTEEGGPYNVTGEMLFNSGANLTIMPNTQVNMLVDSLIVINGNINASNANFTAYGENGWGGLVLNPSSTNSTISGLTLLGAATGITINGCNPILSNLNLTGASSLRTPTTAIVISGDANPVISNIQINNFASGIKATNSSATNVALNMNNISIQQNNLAPSVTDIGIELTGNYSTEIDYIDIIGYHDGITITGVDAAARQARLTNVRVIRTEASSRDLGKAIFINNMNNIFIENDSLSGFSTGIEIANNTTTQAIVNISNTAINKSPAQTLTDIAVKITGLASGTIDSLLVQNYHFGIELSGNQQLSIENSDFINCSTVLKDNQNQSTHSLRNNLVYRNGMFGGIVVAPALELTSAANLDVSNNTIHNYPNILNAASSSSLSFWQNIAWCVNPTASPITLAGGSTINATYNDIALQNGIFPGIGNINANPLYVNANSANFYLDVYSPCINTGNPVNPTDPDGSRADMGAIPYDQTTMPLIADFYCDSVSGQHPLAVHFTNHSTFNANTWNWDFNGDNITDSNVENPSWIYTIPGIYSVKLTVTSNDSTKTKILSNYITVLNSAPMITLDIPDLVESEDFTEFQFDLNNYFADANGDALSFSFVKDSEIVNASLAQGILTISSVPTLNGTVNFTVTANDGLASLSKQKNEQGILPYVPTLKEQPQKVSLTYKTGVLPCVPTSPNRASVSNSFILTVTPVNNPPVITGMPSSFTFDEDGSLQINVGQYVSDIDSSVLSLSISDNEHITAEVNQLNVLLHAQANWSGTEQLTFIVSDNSTLAKLNHRAETSVICTIIVNPVNDPPVITVHNPADSLVSVMSGTTVNFSVTATDIDSQISYAWFVDNINQHISTNTFSHQFIGANSHTVKLVLNDNAGAVLQLIWHVQVTVGNDDNTAPPLVTQLYQNQPNPFSDNTVINYSIKEPGVVKLSVYNMRGQLVKVLYAADKKSGFYSVKWNGKNELGNSVTEGVYILRFETNGITDSKKVLVLRR